MVVVDVLITLRSYSLNQIWSAVKVKVLLFLMWPGVTQFATSFLTLASMYKHKSKLQGLFVSDEWNGSKFSLVKEGEQDENIVLSVSFWQTLENCLRASQPLLIALRIADGDETPAAPEIMAAMDKAKATIQESLKEKP
jgi:hypothetical protein